MNSSNNYYSILRKNNAKEKIKNRSSVMVLVVLILVMLVSFNCAKSFAQSMYNDMKFSNENLISLGIARVDDLTNIRNPAIFSRSDIQHLENEGYIDCLSAYSIVSINLPIYCSSQNRDLSYRASSIRAVDPDFFSISNISFSDGDNFTETDSTSAVIGYNVALSNKLKVNDNLEITRENGTKHTVKISGIMNRLPAQKFNILLSKLNNSIFINASSDWVDEYTLFNSIYISTYPVNDNLMQQYCQNISEFFNYQEFKNRIAPTEVVTTESRLSVWDTTNIWMNYIILFALIFGGLLIFVLLFGMISKVTILVMDSRKEFIILSSIGASYRQLLNIISFKIMFIILKGGVIGALIALLIQNLISKYTNLPFTYSIPMAFISIIVSIFISEISVLIVMKREKSNLIIYESR